MCRLVYYYMHVYVQLPDKIRTLQEAYIWMPKLINIAFLSAPPYCQPKYH